MANTQSQQMTTEELQASAKAFVAAMRYGVQTSGPTGFDMRMIYLIDYRSMPPWWRSFATEATRDALADMEFPSRVLALAAAYDLLHPGETPDVAVVPLVPRDLIKVMGNTIYFSTPAEARSTPDGKWVWLSWSGGAEILHSLEPIFTGKPVKPQ